MRADRLRTRSDRGSVLLITASFAVVALVCLAFVVDLGALRAERKEVTLSTDAAALAGAETIDFDVLNISHIGATTCDQVPSTDAATVEHVVLKLLDRNGASDPEQCTVVIESIRNRRAYVTVTASDDVDFQLAGAVGQSSGRTGGTSSAGVGIVDGGIRPFGICGQTLSLPVAGAPESVYGFGDAPDPWPHSPTEYRSLLALRDPTGSVSGTPLVHFPIDRLGEESPCGSASGNFGQLDLAENAGAEGSGSCVNPQDDDKLCDNTVNGYQGELRNPGGGKTGNSFTTQLHSAFVDLESASEIFWIPVYGAVTDPNGQNTRFTYTHWMKVEAVGHCFTVSPSPKKGCEKDGLDGNPKRWFLWKVLAIVDANGLYMDAPPLTEDHEEFTARLCGVDGDVSYC